MLFPLGFTLRRIQMKWKLAIHSCIWFAWMCFSFQFNFRCFSNKTNNKKIWEIVKFQRMKWIFHRKLNAVAKHRFEIGTCHQLKSYHANKCSFRVFFLAVCRIAGGGVGKKHIQYLWLNWKLTALLWDSYWQTGTSINNRVPKANFELEWKKKTWSAFIDSHTLKMCTTVLMVMFTMAAHFA